MMLDLAQIRAAGSGPQGADLSAKTAALAAWLGEVLALHGSGWRVATHADSRLLATGTGPAVRDSIMGTPARYAEVVWTGDAPGYDPTAPARVFEVGLYYGTDLRLTSPTLTADTAAAWSAFRDVCDNASDTLPGVLYACRRQDEITLDGVDTVALGSPQNVTAGRIPGNARDASDLLALTFTVTLS